MNNTQNLIVPINVQALCIGNKDADKDKPNKKCFIEPYIDFSKLPYQDREGDIINEGASISEKITSSPIPAEGKIRDKGVHLHWTLPNALTEALVKTDQDDYDIKKQTGNESTNSARIKFPLVPNRWLVTRILLNRDKTPSYYHWVIESDSVYDVDEDQDSNNLNKIRSQNKDLNFNKITIPIDNNIISDSDDRVILNSQNQGGKPFLSVGKLFSYENWSEKSSDNVYTSPNHNGLTAIGYGNIRFGSLYSDASSVFGFWDPLEDIDSGMLTYLVSGWYSNSSQDFLKQVKAQINDNRRLFKNLQNESVQKQLLKKSQWEIDESSQVSLDSSISVYSGLIKNIQWDQNKEYLSNNLEVDIAIASTDIEALSAFVANKYSSNIKSAENRSLAVNQNEEDSIIEKLETAINFLQIGAFKDPEIAKDHMKIAQLLHEERFIQSDGGITWSIARESLSQSNANAKNSSQSSDRNIHRDLPAEIVSALNQLNKLQEEFNNLRFVTQSLRWQIFIDWYKYMVNRYDSPRNPGNPEYANIAAFIKEEISSFSNTQLTKLNKVTKALDDQMNSLREEIDQENKHRSDNDKLSLKPSPTPKYYAPRDPAILIANRNGGQWSYAGERNGAINFILKCRTPEQILHLNQPSSPVLTKAVLPVEDTINRLIHEALILAKCKENKAVGQMPEPIANNTWEANNFLIHHLEWEIEYQALKRSKKDDGKNELTEYDLSHITSNFELDFQSNELKYSNKLMDNLLVSSVDAQSYTGYSLLVPGAKFNLAARIDEYLNLYPDDAEKSELSKIKDALPKIGILSQSLHGFNQALLARKATSQLKIDDFIAQSKEDKDFTYDTVRNAVGNMNKLAPSPQDRFNPIQDGIFHIKQLRIIDSFGRYKVLIDRKTNVKDSNVIYPINRKFSRTDGISTTIAYPRITQNSRIIFRLLAENNPEQVTSFYTTDTPICGWVLVNNLDKALTFYDQDGNPLGSVKKGAPNMWESTPGIYQFHTPIDKCFTNPETGQLKNTQLYNFAKSIDNEEKLNDRINTIYRTVNFIEPKNYAQSFANSYLFGRPLALVQAFIRLELQGLPAMNTSWSALMGDINSPELYPGDITNKQYYKRTDNNFSNIVFNVKIGDHVNFYDGVVGYFISDKCGQIDYNKFYTTDNLLPLSSYYQGCDVNDTTKGLKILMLIDPRASIHISSGILPVKQIQIPDYLYVPALQKIHVTFLSTPVINDYIEQPLNPKQEQMIIPVSQYENLLWEWVETSNNAWRVKSIPVSSNKAFANKQQVSEGWLRLKPNLKM